MKTGEKILRFLENDARLTPAQIAVMLNKEEGDIRALIEDYEKDGVIYQLVEAMGDRFVRYSTDSGASWSAWSEKAVNSGGIDTSGEPDEPKEDPFQDLVDRVDGIEGQIETIVGGDTVSIGSTEEGQAILDGTYDYDTGTITGG